MLLVDYHNVPVNDLGVTNLLEYAPANTVCQLSLVIRAL